MKRIKIAQIGTGHDHAFSPIPTFKKLSDIFEFVVETKKDVFCKTVENDYVVAGYSRGKVGFSWDIVKQARMYADFG